MTKIRIVGDSADSARILVVLSYETIAQGHLFTACTLLFRTSQPKDSDFRGKKVSNEEVGLHNGLIYWYRYVGRAI